MAFKQYFTRCIEYNDFKSYWTNFAGQLGGQGPVAPLLINGIIQGVIHSFVASLIGFGFGGGFIGAGIGGAIGFSYGLIEGFADQWLNKRLVCIKHDSCAVGRVAWIETVAKKDWYEAMYDNDTSFNLRLIPYNGMIGNELEFPYGDDYDKNKEEDFKTKYRYDLKHDWKQIEDDGFPAANLLKQQLLELGYGGYEGDESSSSELKIPKLKPNHPGGRWTLHCEVEGNAMERLKEWGKALSLLTPITALVGVPLGIGAGLIYGAYEGAKRAYEAARNACKKMCKIPILCDIVCTIVAAAAAIIGGFIGATLGAILGAFIGTALGNLALATLLGSATSNNGDPNDPESGNIEKEDCLFVAGDLVYDAGHPNSWHEIHPVKQIQKICSNPQDINCCPSLNSKNPDFKSQIFKDEVTLFWDRWCKNYQTSRDPVVIKNQKNPENQWCLHPLIDGCGQRRENTPIGPN